MTKPEAIIHYNTALLTIRKWMNQGLISEVEFNELSAIMAEKYNLPLSSIYRL
jgi:hypothetical protein